MAKLAKIYVALPRFRALKFAAEHGCDREDSSTTAASPIGWASPG
jgi:hypothetical protein